MHPRAGAGSLGSWDIGSACGIWSVLGVGGKKLGVKFWDLTVKYILPRSGSAQNGDIEGVQDSPGETVVFGFHVALLE